MERGCYRRSNSGNQSFRPYQTHVTCTGHEGRFERTELGALCHPLRLAKQSRSSLKKTMPSPYFHSEHTVLLEQILGIIHISPFSSVNIALGSTFITLEGSVSLILRCLALLRSWGHPHAPSTPLSTQLSKFHHRLFCSKYC